MPGRVSGRKIVIATGTIIEAMDEAVQPEQPFPGGRGNTTFFSAMVVLVLLWLVISCLGVLFPHPPLIILLLVFLLADTCAVIYCFFRWYRVPERKLEAD